MSNCVECGLEAGPPHPLGGPRVIKYCNDECRKTVKSRANKKRRQSEEGKLQRSENFQYRRSIIDQVKITAGCADCGYNTAACALDFDHVDKNKSNNVAHMTYNSWLNIYAEIMKCDVVCANCHRIRTNLRGK